MKFKPLSFSAEAIAEQLLGRHQRVLVFGEAGLGKTTLIRELAGRYHARRQSVTCVSCDPGLPGFGPPGVVGLGRWEGADWQLAAYEPLCSLDAARFRLPLVQAVAKLVPRGPGTLFVDMPGFTRGMAAAELLTAIVAVAAPEAVLALHRIDRPIALANELAALNMPVYTTAANFHPGLLDAAARARARTRAWNEYLVQGHAASLELRGVQILGAPPPMTGAAWVGRQVAVGRADRWIGLGEVTALADGLLALRLVGELDGADRLLIRDAGRDAGRELRTLRREPPVRTSASKHAGRAPFELRCGPLVVNLMNGVTGDPLLMLRQRHRRHAMLFDLGDSHAVSQRVLHTVTDVFVSHAHLDHVAGFPYLLRSRLSAPLPPLRLFGPAGMHEHVAGILAGTRWDRIGADGPAFEVFELDGGRLQKFHLQAGSAGAAGPVTDATDGVLLQTPELSVRAVELDHAIPVLAFALEMVDQLNVDAGRLKARRLPPGPWIGDLKANVRHGDLDASIALPDGSSQRTGDLAEQLLRTSVGPKLVYATDLADHADNRRKLIDFAAGAALLVCESTFRAADRALAEQTQHLTTGACAAIACAARVQRLVPFHFSKRYEGNLDAVYDEIARAAGSITIERHGAV